MEAAAQVASTQASTRSRAVDRFSAAPGAAQVAKVERLQIQEQLEERSTVMQMLAAAQPAQAAGMEQLERVRQSLPILPMVALAAAAERGAQRLPAEMAAQVDSLVVAAAAGAAE